MPAPILNSATVEPIEISDKTANYTIPAGRYAFIRYRTELQNFCDLGSFSVTNSSGTQTREAVLFTIQKNGIPILGTRFKFLSRVSENNAQARSITWNFTGVPLGFSLKKINTFNWNAVFQGGGASYYGLTGLTSGTVTTNLLAGEQPGISFNLLRHENRSVTSLFTEFYCYGDIENEANFWAKAGDVFNIPTGAVLTFDEYNSR